MTGLALRCIPWFVVALTLLAHGEARASDPTTADCLQANERSIALRNHHLLRAARSELLVCAAPTCPEEVREECARRVADVNAQMPTIVFEARDQQNDDLSAVSVAMDGQPLVERLEGTAISIDPGQHTFVFTLANQPPMQRELLIREGEKGRREKVVFGEAPQRPFETAHAAAPPAPPANGATEGNSHATARVAGIAIGAAGVVGLGVALAEQITANTRASHSQRAADSDDPAVVATTHELYQQASKAQTYAIVIGSISTAVLGVGLYVLLTNLDDARERDTANARSRLVPEFGPRTAKLTYTRTF